MLTNVPEVLVLELIRERENIVGAVVGVYYSYRNPDRATTSSILATDDSGPDEFHGVPRLSDVGLYQSLFGSWVHGEGEFSSRALRELVSTQVGAYLLKHGLLSVHFDYEIELFRFDDEPEEWGGCCIFRGRELPKGQRAAWAAEVL